MSLKIDGVIGPSVDPELLVITVFHRKHGAKRLAIICIECLDYYLIVQHLHT